MQRHSELVRAVHEHWVLTGVDLEQADDMADELADHLTAAAADGKDIEAVVGPDLRAFADEWAAPLAEPPSPRDVVRLTLLGAATCATANVAADALVNWQRTVTVDPVTTGVLALLGGLMANILVGPRLSRLGRTGLRGNTRVLLPYSLVWALLASVVIWGTTRFEAALAVTLPTWLVVVSAVVTFAITIGPLVALFLRAEQTEGWTKRIARILDGLL